MDAPLKDQRQNKAKVLKRLQHLEKRMLGNGLLKIPSWAFYDCKGIVV